MSRLLRRLSSPVLALFFLAPLVGEFFLGDFPVILIFLIVAFAPLYGGGALLIRELTRRTGRGWPTIIVLGLAYGVFEEGLVTQSLFNPHYLDQDLIQSGYVSWLHTGVLWVVYVVSLHMYWSISVPIALVEEANPERRTRPWLGWKGLTVTAVLLVIGSIGGYTQNKSLNHNYDATTGERLVTAAVVIVLVAIAFLLPKRGENRPDGTVPSGWVTGAVALAGGLIFKAGLILPNWPLAVIAFLVGPAIVLVLTGHWSRRAAWGQEQRLGIAGGTLLTYSWAAFTAHSAGFVVDLISHIIYAVAAISILWWVARRMRTENSA
jgi:hypothetical protein